MVAYVLCVLPKSNPSSFFFWGGCCALPKCHKPSLGPNLNYHPDQTESVMTFLSKRIAAALAGTAMLVTPLAASAAPANPAASLSVARASTPTAHASKLGASVPTTTLISIGVLAALVAIVLVATGGDDDDNDTPASR